MTFICLNIELRTQPLIILVVIAGTDKERPGHRIENRPEASLGQNYVRDFSCAGASQQV